MIKLSVFDFDGVFTDGKIVFNDDKIVKSYNIKDGMGIKLLKESNIEVMILSGFKNNTSQQNISDHLKIECCFGCKDKKKKIREICLEKNINLNEISYMGDDINDVELLIESKISGCPSDAVDECKYVCDFISSKKGGEGCVREFCDYILSSQENKNNEIIKQIKKEFNHQISNYNFEEIDFLAKKIIETNKKNNIYFSGVGKSGNNALHLCSLLKSVNISCSYLNCIDSIHGDIGSIRKDDLLIFFSRSGNTTEIISITDHLMNKKCYLYGICCLKNSKFENKFHKTFVIPHLKEIKVNNIDKVPTNSCMSQLLFSNILVSKIIEYGNIDIEKYGKNHPGGNIGFSMKKIKDVIIKTYPKIIMTEDKETEIIDVLLEMNKFNLGCCFFFDCDEKFIGILSDSDIRKLFIKKYKTINKENININFKYEDNLEKKLIDCIKMRYVPVIIEHEFVGYIEFAP